MSTLTLTLTPTIFRRLQERAERAGRPPAKVAEDLLAEQLTSPAEGETEREQVARVLRRAGLLSELGPELPPPIDPTVRPEEVVTALARAGGKPLSQIVLEQRGPRL